MANVVLHIGAGKCGSSAIQTALTKRPVLKRADGSHVVYGIIDNSGELIYGQQIHGKESIRGYQVSVDARRIVSFDAEKLAAIRHQLDQVEADTLVLSNEGWLSQYKRVRRLLPHFGKSVRAVAYVRPPVNYLNAAWWQWGAWQDRDLDEWLAARLPATQWAVPLSAWRADPYVGELTIRLLQGDVAKDFLLFLGAEGEASQGSMVNRGLPAPILRLFQMNRELRPTGHASQIDFILSKRVNHVGSAPWVLDQERVKRIITRTMPSNSELLGMLSPNVAERMRNDRHWWDAQAFADKKVEPWEPQLPEMAEIEQLCVAMAEAIVRMERQIVNMKHR